MTSQTEPLSVGPATTGVVERPLRAQPPVTTEVVGIPLALTDYERTMDWMDAAVAAGQRATLVHATVHLVMLSHEDEQVRDAVLASDLVVPDGQPLVWALNALGHHLHDRVYGPELMARHCARAARAGTRVYLYGGRNQGALVQLALNLRRAHPGLQIVGGYAPPFRPLNGEEEDALVEEINRSGADIVWVGIGQPKQEKWMRRMRPRLEAPVLVGVGAAFDFHAGLQPQAPDWMQSSGLEWAYRLAHEPRRLWKRYFRYNPRFVAGFARQYAGHRRRGAAR
jgi:N-acetylglucosaminyldiphosphoundecaprenol N-acetyl-beta-D-mannosaminyltransferase